MAEDDLRRQLAELQQQLAQRDAVTLDDLLDTPPVFADNAAHIGFVETAQWTSIHEKLQLLVQAAPDTSMRRVHYTVVIGVMGSGKTTTAWRAVQWVCDEQQTKKVVPIFCNLSSLTSSLAEFEAEKNDPTVLATVLLACFTGFERYKHGATNLRKVAKLAQDKYHAKHFILHIDEFQCSVETTKKLLLACRDTLIGDAFGIHVIPIVSGVPGLDFPADVSMWNKNQVQMGPLPEPELWRSFADALHVPPTIDFNGARKNLSLLFWYCGGYASQVVSLYLVINTRHPKLLANEDLSHAEARVVFDLTLKDIAPVFSVARWHAMFHDGDAPTVDEYAAVTSRVLVQVLNKTPIESLDGRPARGVSWRQIELGGMVSLELCDPNFPSSGYLAKCSWFAMWCINNLHGVQVIPTMAWLENPFHNDSAAHERLALVSFRRS